MPDQIVRAGLTFVGYAVGGPFGALAGGILGDLLFPKPDIKGPRLNELNFQRSTVGAPIPITYGTVALAGNVIWSSGLIETKHDDEQGGLFGIGGQTTTTYTYSVDVAIGICEGPIDGIRRIWADADLIFDASDDSTLADRFDLEGVDDSDFFGLVGALRAMSAQLRKDVYLGTEDQLPDPTIESYIGVGLVPAYRGLAYVVFNQFQLEKYGNRIPNFRFEVYTGAPTECGIYSGGNLEPWAFQLDGGVYDPRNPDNNHIYGWMEFGGSVNTTLSAALAAMQANYDRPFLIGDIPQIGQSTYIHGWSTSITPNQVAPCNSTGSAAIADYIEIQISINSIENVDRNCNGGSTSVSCDEIEAAAGYQNVIHITKGQHSGFWVYTLSGDSSTAEEYFGYPADGGGDACATPTGTARALRDHQLGVRRTLLPPDPCALGTPLAGAPGYCVVGGIVTQGITWTPVSGTFKVLQAYTTGLGGSSNLVLKYPVNPCLISTDPNYNDQAYWEAAYAQALADGEPIASGLVYGVDYPETSSTAYFSECETVDAECVPMAVIVADICRRAGLRTDTSTQIDVAGLTSCVPGYVIGRQMSGRDAMGPLRLFGLWDAVETNALLKFVERGGAIVETLTADDLGVHENGSQAPTVMEVTRVQEKDLPRRLRLHFTNFEHDHEVSEQSASRITTEAIDELDVELPISMNPDTAAQLAEIMLYAHWVGRNTYRFSLDNSRLALEPTDCLEIPVDGETVRCRIVAVDYSIGGILRVDAVRDDDGSYVSTAVAQPSQPSGGVPGGPGSALICPTGIVLLDIPRLNPAHTDAGYYAAVYNTCGNQGWECAEIYRSSDGGLTFGRVARSNGETTVGEILDITGPATDPTLPGDSPAYDTTSAITVTLFEGELSSITDAQIEAGQNLAAIGSDGRWVIIQFKTATLDTTDQYTLTDLIWGVNDTSHLLGTTVDGDTFVLLSDADLLRLPETADNIGVEKQFKAVTCGESIDAVTEFDFTTWGLSYLRLCPSTVLSATLTSPPTSAADGESYLLPNDTSLSGVWATHGGEISTWSDETDSWVFCTPASGTIITIQGDSSEPPTDVISGGDGTYTPAPWTPAIPPLSEAGTSLDPDTTYAVVHDGTNYYKVPLADLGGGDTGGGGAAISRSTDQSITASTHTFLAFTSEDRDDNDYADLGTLASGFTIPADGWYSIYVTAYWGAVNAYRALYIRQNATTTTNGTVLALHTHSTGFNMAQAVPAIAYLTAGDTIRFTVFVNPGDTLLGATLPVRAAIHRLGA